MTFKRILSLLCVLTLVLTLVSGFAFATSQEAGAEVDEEGNNTRSASYCYAKQDTTIYAAPNYNVPVKDITAGEMLQILPTGSTTTWRHVKTMDGYYEGYVLRTHIIEPG